MSGEYGEFFATTFESATDLTATQYHFLANSAAGKVVVASEAAGGANDLIGVQMSKVASGHDVLVAYQGEVRITAGGAITANTYITTNGSGRAAAAVSGDLVAGRALEAAGADGEQFRALIFPPVPLLRT